MQELDSTYTVTFYSGGNDPGGIQAASVRCAGLNRMYVEMDVQVP